MDFSPENYQITIGLETLGCKLNQAETETLQAKLESSGCRIVSFKEMADIYILNTCTVTSIADRKSRHLLKMARRRNPTSKIIAVGCYAEHAAREMGDLPGVDVIIGNKAKPDLFRILIEHGYILRDEMAEVPRTARHTRSFIKIQDGCSNFCTYCIVPSVRGKEKSRPPEEVIDEIKQRVARGYKEVVLTGTEIGCYRYREIDLQGLIECILKETTIDRLRLSSLQPQELSPEFIRLWRNPRLCRHFHVSLQSGSDTALKRMGRHYSLQDYCRALDQVRSLIPGVAVTTDLIVGFPGETENEFKESFEFCRRMKFARTHIFPYSRRKNTPAAKMNGQIDTTVKKRRSRIMLDLAQKSQEEYQRSFMGAIFPVLVEQRSEEFWEGLTDNYLRVYFTSSGNLTNCILPVKITGLKTGGVEGVAIV